MFERTEDLQWLNSVIASKAIFNAIINERSHRLPLHLIVFEVCLYKMANGMVCGGILSGSENTMCQLDYTKSRKAYKPLYLSIKMFETHKKSKIVENSQKSMHIFPTYHVELCQNSFICRSASVLNYTAHNRDGPFNISQIVLTFDIVTAFKSCNGYILPYVDSRR